MTDSATLSHPEQESLSKPAQRRSGQPINAPWDLIELEYVRGTSQRQLASKFGVQEATIAQRCHRNGWERKRRQAKALASATLSARQSMSASGESEPGSVTACKADAALITQAGLTLADRQEAWKADMQRIATKLARGVSRVDAEALGDQAQTKKLAEAASALASVDTIGRRQLGLENEQASQPVMLGVQFGVQVQVNQVCENPPPDDAA